MIYNLAYILILQTTITMATVYWESSFLTEYHINYQQNQQKLDTFLENKIGMLKTKNQNQIKKLSVLDYFFFNILKSKKQVLLSLRRLLIILVDVMMT